MEKPIVKIIEEQQVESTREVTGSEAEEILRKYGHAQQFSTRQEETPVQQPGLTFEEMLAQQELKEKNEKLRKQQQMSGPRPTTFGGQNGYDTEVKYGSDESGFGFKIEIITDMKLPKY